MGIFMIALFRLISHSFVHKVYGAFGKQGILLRGEYGWDK